MMHFKSVGLPKFKVFVRTGKLAANGDTASGRQLKRSAKRGQGKRQRGARGAPGFQGHIFEK